MCRGLRDAGTSATAPAEGVVPFRSREHAVKREPFLSNQQVKQHQGEFVAVKRGSKKEIIASSKSYKKVVDAAKKLGAAFCVIAVRKKGTVYTH